MNAQDQYRIVEAAISNGTLDEAWDLVAQFEELFLGIHTELCNELSSKVSAIDPIFNKAA